MRGDSAERNESHIPYDERVLQRIDKAISRETPLGNRLCRVIEGMVVLSGVKENGGFIGFYEHDTLGNLDALFLLILRSNN